MRDIDWSKPLSDEDRVWVEQRLDKQSGKDGLTLGEQLTKNDQEHGREAVEAKKSRAERISDLRTAINNSQNEIERLEREQAEEDNRNAALAGTLGDRANGLLVKDNTPVNGERPEGAPEAQDDYDDEKKWNVAALRAEIDKRNEELPAEERIAKNGNRSELVERLRKDDEALAAAEEN